MQNTTHKHPTTMQKHKMHQISHAAQLAYPALKPNSGYLIKTPTGYPVQITEHQVSDIAEVINAHYKMLEAFITNYCNTNNLNEAYLYEILEENIGSTFSTFITELAYHAKLTEISK
jgi:hypothetical protein